MKAVIDQTAGRFPAPTLVSFSGWLRRFGPYTGLALLLVIAAVAAPDFYQPANLFNVLRQSSILGLVAIGQTLVLLVAGIDLSISGVMGLALITVAGYSHGRDERLLAGMLLALVFGIVVGIGNGLLITKRRVPPFVATLGMLVLIEGTRLAYTKGVPSGALPPAMTLLANATVGPLPLGFVLWMVLNGLFVVLLYATPYGRHVYATGANREAARLSAVPVNRVVVSTYVLCSVLAALAGLILSGYIGYVDRYLGRGFDLDSIAAVVVGGTSFAGGRGGLGGTFAGVLLVTSLVNIILLLNLNVQLQLVVKGLVIIGAVALYSYRRR